MNEPTDTPTPRSDSFAIPYHAIKCPRFPNGEWDVNGRWVSLGDCRLLERENQQLQREVKEAKHSAQQAKEHYEFYRQKVSDYIGAEQEWIKSHNHFKQLAEERWQMCEKQAAVIEQLKNMIKDVLFPKMNEKGPTEMWLPEQMEVSAAMANTDAALSHFHSLQQQKKDEPCSTEEKSNS